MAEARDVVYARLLGGAGNQLFQYAAGRALADRLDCDLMLDTRYIKGSDTRGDCFGHFAQARFRLDAPLPPAKSGGILRYGIWRALGRSPRIYRERGLGFDPALLLKPKGTYLHGYWQSEQYFSDIAAQIRTDLAFTTPLDAENADMAAQIADAPCPVAVHVRRGDYVALGNYAACTPEYYRAAAREIARRTGQTITCFVFSNDPEWARTHLALGFDSVVVDLNDETRGHYDMALMARCAHNVIANSTFSWWAAWLNASPEKIVIAPKAWFTKPALENPDLIPPAWLCL